MDELVGILLGLARQHLGVWETLLVLLILGLLVFLKRKVGDLKLPALPPPSPDLVDNPPSPPIPLTPDGSIPIANPVTPPDQGPM